jgi:hypothetical protein
MLNRFFNLKHAVVISFDRQISDHGWHDFIHGRHYIRLGLRLTEHLDIVCQKHEFINTLLHELYHAVQHEEFGRARYSSPEIQGIPGVTHQRISYQYCPLELAARAFADHNHQEAVALYEEFAAEISSAYRTRSQSARIRRKHN